MSAQLGSAGDADRLLWARWGAAAGVVGMLALVVGVALIPLDMKLANGDQRLAAVTVAHVAQLNVAGLLAVAGGVLLTAQFAVLTRLVPEGRPGWGLLRVSLAGCVITQTMVAVGASFALVAVHSAVAGAPAALVALAVRGLWLTFLASAVPTILFTVTGVLGLRAAALAPTWVAVLGWISAAGHVVVMTTFAQSGPFAPDDIVGALTPLTTVLWILGLSATLPRRVRVAGDTAPPGGGAAALPGQRQPGEDVPAAQRLARE
jgi:hypothetical protein